MNSKIKKQRADILLVQNNYCKDIDDAKKLILEGNVRVGSDRVISKSNELLPIDIIFNITNKNEYVSRGAYKLLPAFDKYLPRLNGLVALDIGASTGGFTDLMLQKGAKRVYTVDVGTAQLHYKLRLDPRVIVMEQTNVRYFNSKSLPEKVNLMTMDVSFISVLKLLVPLKDLFMVGSFAFILIKPQFELPSSFVEKGGVVRSEKARIECINKVVEFIENKLYWQVFDTIKSPIKGPKGNQEYVLCIKIN